MYLSSKNDRRWDNGAKRCSCLHGSRKLFFFSGNDMIIISAFDGCTKTMAKI